MKQECGAPSPLLLKSHADGSTHTLPREVPSYHLLHMTHYYTGVKNNAGMSMEQDLICKSIVVLLVPAFSKMILSV